MGKRWSQQDIELLMKVYPRIGGKTLASNLHRTLQSVSDEASKLGIKRETWSLEELNQLKKFYPTYSKDKVTEMIPNKTWNAIRGMAFRLNLRRSRIRISEIKFNLSEGWRGYIAGMMDGEGTIRPNPQPSIAIYNSNLETLETIRKLLNIGNIHPKQAKPKPIWLLEITGCLKVLSLLLFLKPYLIIKRRKGEQTINLILERLKSEGYTEEIFKALEMDFVVPEKREV